MAKQSEADKRLVEKLTELFKYAYGEVSVPWESAQRYVDRYDRLIDKGEWSTMSEIVIPFSMVAVDQSMSFMIDYMFPRNMSWMGIRPRDRALQFETVDLVRQYVQDALKTKMRLRRQGFLTIKDSVKIGVGYGIVEPKQVRPERSVMKLAEFGGEVVGLENTVEDGAPELAESYRYLPFFSVIPMPGGADPDEVSGVFLLDFKYEDELKQMYEVERALPRDRRVLRGDPVEIIKNTIERKMNGSARPTLEILSALAGQAGMDKLKTGVDAANLIKNLGGDDNLRMSNAVIQVPILKCLFRNRHVWLANGDEIILDIDDALVTRKNPIVMAQSNPDAGRWFTPGIIAASEDPDMGTNIFYNALMDMLSEHLHPTRIFDRRAFPDGIPPRAAFQDIESWGQPKDAVLYTQPPPIGPGLLQIGEQLQQFGAAAKGQPLALQGQAAPGLLRSGVGGFESLLSGSFGRQKMTGMLIESGWLESTIIRTLSLAQAVITSDGRTFVSEREGPDGRPEYYEQKITPDEIRNAFVVSVNLDQKFKNAIADENIKLQKFQVMKDDIYVDPYEHRLDFWEDDEKARRFLGSRQRVSEIQEAVQARAVEIAAEVQAQQIIAQQQQEQQTGGEQVTTQTEQAVAGGASQLEGVGSV